MYDITFPPEVSAWLNSFGSFVSIGLSSTRSLFACAGLETFEERIGFWNLVPPVCIRPSVQMDAGNSNEDDLTIIKQASR